MVVLAAVVLPSLSTTDLAALPIPQSRPPLPPVDSPVAMSSPRPMPTRPARGLVDLASSVTSSFMPASPIVQEIVASDLSEMPCEEAADEPSDDRSESGEEPGNGPTLYRQPHGIASGYSRPAVLPEPVGEPVLTKGEKKESRKQERNLLRDNHLLPPKHSSSSGGSVVKRAYWRLFGAQDGEPAGGGSNPTETSPLLQDRQPEGPSPDSAQLDEQWNAALASGSLQTTWRREAKTIAGYSQSLIVTFVLQYSINMASIFFIGHIGTMELGAISCKRFRPVRGILPCTMLTSWQWRQ